MVTPYWLPVRGGVTTFVVGLSQELQRSSSIEVHVVAREGSGPDAMVVGGTPQEFAARTVAELERIRPDVVHAHGHWYALQSACQYRRRHPETRTVFTLHTEFPSGSVLRDFVLGRMLSRMDVITALSRYVLDKTSQMVRFRARTEVVPPGVNMTRAPSDRVGAFVRSAHLEQRRPLIGFLGPLTHSRKAEGVARLVDAMSRLRLPFPGSTLAVAGDGPQRGRLEALANRTLAGGAAFLGMVENPAEFLSALDIYAHISLQEGFGLAILEAMACGTPVVATNVGGIPEIVRPGANGLLVSEEPREIADALLSLITSRDVASRLAGNASRDVSERFTWRRAAERFLEIYST